MPHGIEDLRRAFPREVEAVLRDLGLKDLVRFDAPAPCKPCWLKPTALTALLRCVCEDSRDHDAELLLKRTSTQFNPNGKVICQSP